MIINYVDRLIGKCGTVDFLYELNNVQFDLTNEEKAGVLIYYASNDDIEPVKYFLNNGFDINGKDENGCNAVTAACNRGHIKMVKFLLSYPNLNINEQCSNNFTPLLVAATSSFDTNKEAIVKLLIDRGCYLLWKNGWDFTFFDHLTNSQKIHCCSLIVRCVMCIDSNPKMYPKELLVNLNRDLRKLFF